MLDQKTKDFVVIKSLEAARFFLSSHLIPGNWENGDVMNSAVLFGLEYAGKPHFRPEGVFVRVVGDLRSMRRREYPAEGKRPRFVSYDCAYETQRVDGDDLVNDAGQWIAALGEADAELEAVDYRDSFNSALARTPPDEREIIKEVYVKGRPILQIARERGVPFYQIKKVATAFADRFGRCWA